MDENAKLSAIKVGLDCIKSQDVPYDVMYIQDVSYLLKLLEEKDREIDRLTHIIQDDYTPNR